MNDIVELAFDKFSLTCKVSNLESQLAAVTERAEKAEAQLYIHIAANDELFRLNDEILKRAEQAEARMKRMEDAFEKIFDIIANTPFIDTDRNALYETVFYIRDISKMALKEVQE